MEQEDKELLIKDLCARVPHHTKVSVAYWVSTRNGKFELEWYKKELTSSLLHDIDEEFSWEHIKPYLRPMSSMTEEEKEEYKHLVAFGGNSTGAANFVDWLNAHHFDYRGLIEKDLAIEVTDKNNPYEITD